MNESKSKAARDLNSLPWCALWLCVALVLVTGVVAAINGARVGSDGVAAALVAGALVGAGMLVALFFTASAGRGAVAGSLLSQIVRLGAPLAGGFLLQRAGGRLADAGIFGCVLAIYLPLLVVETWLAVRLLAARQRNGAAHG